MKAIDTKLLRRISIGPEHWDIPMRVELRPYLEFNRRMASQLRALEVRWAGHQPQANFPPSDNRPRRR